MQITETLHKEKAMSVNMSPKFSREELAAFCKTLDDDRLMQLEVYSSHESQLRDKARKAGHITCDRIERKFPVKRKAYTPKPE
jgi:hypothetical protein